VGLVGWALLRFPLTAVTGWLRQRPGVRQAIPALARQQAALWEPAVSEAHPA
jgi:undecaprenyl-diphosphatase